MYDTQNLCKNMLWNGKSIIKKSNNTTETMRKLKQLKYVINVEIKY